MIFLEFVLTQSRTDDILLTWLTHFAAAKLKLPWLAKGEMVKTQSNTDKVAIVVDSEGRCGSSTTVWFSGSVQACKNFAKQGGCRVLEIGYAMDKGTKILTSELNDMISSGSWIAR